ncbi:major facilitator superfamily domain-containing protein [Syncephalis plumigaleata]|nr:major facilitator superfamily domain-containing protein [Syncephalis plumigaleata]
MTVIPQLTYFVRDLHSEENEADIGYYYGYLLSAYNVAQLASVIPWGYLSDRLGRRPLLLIGMLSATISALFLSFSQSYQWLFVFVVLKGLCSPSLAAARSALGDITNHETQARAFRLLFAMFVVGSTVSPVITGQLTDIKQHFPDSLGRSEWLRRYPYFLPFLFSALLTLTGFFVILVCFTETLAMRNESSNADEDGTSSDTFTNQSISNCPPLLLRQNSNIIDYHAIDDLIDEERLPLNEHYRKQEEGQFDKIRLWQILRQHVIILASICAFELVDGMLENLFGLWIATPIDLGGLSMKASDSGIVAGVAGVAVFISQITLYPMLERRYGSRQLYSLVLLLLLPLSILAPYINTLARSKSSHAMIWVWISLLGSTCYRGIIEIIALTSLQLVMTESIRDTGALGMMNGATHSMTSLAGTVGPMLTGSTWSWSISNGRDFPFNFTFLWNILSVGIIVLWGFSRKLQ